ncbi:nuclease-related domain-containing protein [Streptomyces sp. NPDC058045]|uniref:nuclease-related domain-containing protein n=1 Tax=Streptomyces sp. NPDC058045 TaxID=3346311 RepID=UPI0036E7B55F
MVEELTVTAWQYFGHDRLYVNLPDGTAIGWADRRTGEITVVHARYRDAVTDALARRVPELLPARPRVSVHAPSVAEDADEGEQSTGAAPPEEPMAAVPSDDGQEPPAGQDRKAFWPGEGPLPGPASAGEGSERGPGGGRADEATAFRDRSQALRQSLNKLRENPRRPPEGRRPAAPLPPLTPATDLAGRRPGAGLRTAAPGRTEEGAADTGTLERLSSRILRRRPLDEDRRRDLLGERRAGAELNRLTRHGWRVLHSVPLPDGADLDHLLLGPGGVFTVRTVHHPQQPVRVEEDAVRIGDGEPLPYLAECRAEAAFVQKTLERHCDFPLRVEPVLVFVAAAGLDVAATLSDVRVYRERQVSALAPLTGQLTARQLDHLHELARHAELWREP